MIAPPNTTASTSFHANEGDNTISPIPMIDSRATEIKSPREKSAHLAPPDRRSGR
jgi:hypothetical protein